MKQKEIIITKGKHQYLYTRSKKYLDFSLSSGALILGHSNKIFKKSILNQVDYGSNYSSNNINKEKYTKLLKKNFKNLNEFEFSNSGSESNLRALRLAKAVTNRKKYAMVNGSWHGSIDQFLFDFKRNEKKNSFEVKDLSSGITKSKNLIILPYNDIKLSKKILDTNKDQISVIVIEPIQCGVPNNNSIKYLKFLQNYCKKQNILLWFDEVITGMRVNKLAVFHKHNFKPDIVTFAKCFGGGMPIGITAFNKKISIKKKILKQDVFFGGTFSGNPLSTKVGYETFKYYLKNQRKLNKKINILANKLEKEVNNFCLKNNIKFRLQRYESIMRPIFTNKNVLNKMEREKYDKNFINSIKFKNYLLDHNIFISSNCSFFISACHNSQNITSLIKTIKKFAIDKLNNNSKINISIL